MKRRRFLISAATFAASAGVTGWWLLKSPTEEAFTSLAEVKGFLISKGEKLTANGQWSAFKVVSHLAQSIELSIIGYPQNESKLFQNTLGSLAFHIFNAKGAMTHKLSKDIPGAQPIAESGALQTAVKRLLSAIEQWEKTESFKPHFAYGELTKKQFTQAHLFHINEHFAELSLQP